MGAPVASFFPERMTAQMSSLKRYFSVVGAPRNIANATLFNLSWFAILLTQSSIVAIAIIIVHLFLHFTFIANVRREGLLIASVALIGALLDQLMFALGVFTLNGQAALAPLWLACLWPAFATTLRHAFAFLQDKPYAAALFGAVGGALSYVAGVRLTDVEFGSPLWGPVVVGLCWAVLFPLLLKLAAPRVSRVDPLQSWEPSARRVYK